MKCYIECVILKLLLYLGRDWRWHPEESNELYLKIISLFEDDPKHHFSLHRMAECGLDFGKAVGEWYGPNTVAHVLR